ncbi:MAG: protein translocase subunit SecD [Lachnospiraceae bacterium]|nr:protein translocase subunit SecD [Lachnospiraceae bacterium]
MGKKIFKLVAAIAMLALVVYAACFGFGKDKYGSASDIKLGLDLNGGISITFETLEANPSAQDMDDTIYKLQQRIQQYSTEALVYQEGDNRITVEIPLKNVDTDSAKEILEELGKPGSLEFIDMDEKVIIDGSHVKGAQAKYYQDDLGQTKYMVALTLTDEGSKLFADGTARVAAETVDSKKYIKIVYDGEEFSKPRCTTKIEGGSVSIDNIESIEKAESLASTIRIGAIPLELKTIRSNIVAAQLGSDAIKTGLMAGLIGLIIIVLFMCAYYRIPGIAASLALVMYIGLVVFTISAFDITLTLPGIAGIVLTIGMAVDANVVIFARIREELALGHGVEGSIKTGFSKATSAILDGNITTLIAAAVLYIMGSGSIKGFASTLAIGTLLSMFTALCVTRFILKALYGVGCKSVKLYGVQKERKLVDFVGKKHIFFIASLVVIVIGIGAMVFNGANDKGVLNWGIEFDGGTSTSIIFKDDMSQETLEKELTPVISEVIGTGEIQYQKVADSTEVIVKTRELTMEESEKLNNLIVEKYGVDKSLVTAQSISSTISNEMKADALIAVAVSTIAMLIYIWFRFSNIRFATSAVMALVHDVLIVVGFYALTRMTVGSTFVACALTVVGYSINATIVIFDRVRENLAAAGKKFDLAEVLNRSVTQTLSRTINSSLTTAVMLVALLIFGVTSIREFALPILIGVVCGTYSSVCLAGSLWYVFMKKFPPKEDDED